MKFSYQYDKRSPRIEIVLSPQSVLSEVLEGFDKFLKAAGYVYEGEIGIVKDEEQ